MVKDTSASWCPPPPPAPQRESPRKFESINLRDNLSREIELRCTQDEKDTSLLQGGPMSAASLGQLRESYERVVEAVIYYVCYTLI